MIPHRAGSVVRAAAAAACLILPAAASPGQCPWRWADGYERNGALVGGVWDSVVFDDGSGPALWCCNDGGRVSRFDGYAWREVGRAYGNSSGVASGITYKLAVCDPDGPGPLGDQLFVCGGFRRMQGPTGSPVTARGVARWTGSAWVDAGPASIGTGLIFIRAMTTYDNGTGRKLVIANEALPGNVGIMIRDHSGSWSALDAGLSVTSGTELNVVHAFNDGSGEALYVGGLFEGLNSGGLITSPGVIKWTGDGWEGLGTGVRYSTGEGGRVYGLTHFDNGSGPKLVASGNIHSAGGDFTIRGVAMWTGAAWVGFSGADYTLGLFGPYVRVLDLGSGPSLYLNGPLGAMPDIGVVRWTGTGWVGFGWDSSFGIPFAVNAFDPDGAGPASTRLVGLRNTPQQHDGATWSPLPNYGATNGVGSVGRLQVIDLDGAGPEGPSLLALPNGSSRMFTVGGTALNRLGRFDGTTWTSLHGGLSDLHVNLGGDPTNEGNVHCAAMFDSGGGPQLHVGGWFTHLDGQVKRRIVRWDGSAWEEVGGGVGPETVGWDSDRVWDMAVFNDGSGEALYACGTFTRAGTATVSNIARWNGSAWSDVGGGVSGGSGVIRTAVVFNDGSGPALYVAGSFTTAGAASVGNIARWNGTSWSAVGTGFNNEVLALHIHDDGSGAALYTAGRFTTADGSSAIGIARWNGTSWSAVGGAFARGNGFTGTVRVSALASLDEVSGPLLVAGGQFELISGVTVNHLAKWNGSAWSGFDGGTTRAALGVAGSVDAAAVYAPTGAQRLFAAGVFDFAGPISSASLGEWKRHIPADFNNSGTITVQDIFDFLAAYFAGAPSADFNNSGTITVQDIFDLLAAYFAGCP